MPEPRYRRLKEERPAQITEAAFDVFAEQGYAAARVSEVARRAGVSKGLMTCISRPRKSSSRPWSGAWSCHALTHCPHRSTRPSYR